MHYYPSPTTTPPPSPYSILFSCSIENRGSVTNQPSPFQQFKIKQIQPVVNNNLWGIWELEYLHCWLTARLLSGRYLSLLYSLPTLQCSTHYYKTMNITIRPPHRRPPLPLLEFEKGTSSPPMAFDPTPVGDPLLWPAGYWCRRRVKCWWSSWRAISGPQFVKIPEGEPTRLLNGIGYLGFMYTCPPSAQVHNTMIPATGDPGRVKPYRTVAGSVWWKMRVAGNSYLKAGLTPWSAEDADGKISEGGVGSRGQESGVDSH